MSDDPIRDVAQWLLDNDPDLGCGVSADTEATAAAYFAAEEFVKRLRAEVLGAWLDASDASRASKTGWDSSRIDVRMCDGSLYEVTVRLVRRAAVVETETGEEPK